MSAEHAGTRKWAKIIKSHPRSSQHPSGVNENVYQKNQNDLIIDDNQVD